MPHRAAYSKFVWVLMFLIIAAIVFSFVIRLNNEARCADEGGTYMPSAEVCVNDDGTVIFENEW